MARLAHELNWRELIDGDSAVVADNDSSDNEQSSPVNKKAKTDNLQPITTTTATGGVWEKVAKHLKFVVIWTFK